MRTLEPIEIRILGSLLEKQLATPEYYPLTLNALAAACNQKTSRDPVTDYSEHDLERALARLQDERLVCRVVGYRGDIAFDPEKPDGSPRKLMNSGRLAALGWKPAMRLEEGVAATYAWFLENAARGRAA